MNRQNIILFLTAFVITFGLVFAMRQNAVFLLLIALLSILVFGTLSLPKLIQGVVDSINETKQSLENLQSMRQEIKQYLKEDVQSMRQEITQVVNIANETMKETFKLNNTLTGNNATQGVWGEMVLINLLERAGLRKGHEFVCQFSTTNGEGDKIIPDVIVNLPNGHKVIIDSKISLKSYEKYVNTPLSEEKDNHLKQHASSIKKHITSLSSKNYGDINGCIGCIIMFMAVESAFISAIQYDPDILEDGFKHNIVIVGPNSLFCTLKIFSQVWKEHYLRSNIQDIVLQNRKLEEKTIKLMNEIDSMGKIIEKLKLKHDTLMSLINHPKNGLLKHIDKFEELSELDKEKDK